MRFKGPEYELVRDALSAGLPLGLRGDRHFLREVKLPTGQPDIVVVAGTRTGSQSPRLSTTQLKVTHHLWCRGPQDTESLARQLLMSYSHVEAVLLPLQEMGRVRAADGRWRAMSLRSAYNVRRIVAIEAKVSAWRRALAQARANQWFASSTYILMPRRSISADALVEARMFGVGVLSYSSGRVRRELKPSLQPIPISYGSWLVSDLVMGDMRD